MCVTNTIKRRPMSVPISAATIESSASMVSKRLLSSMNFLPFEASSNNSFPSTEPTYQSPCDMYTNSVQVPSEKPRPKRRRKPQKPGKTAKMNDRHFVVHNYHDHAMDQDENDHSEEEGHRRRGGVAIAFPLKLHAVLDQVEADGLGHIVSWQPHGRCFVVHKPKEFVDHVMPKYFRQTKLTSFQRQLNLYGFCRLTRGPDAGGYYHELFLRGKTFLCNKMVRTKVKGTKFKAASSPENEPDFYTMSPVVVTPPHSSDDDSSVEAGHRASISSKAMHNGFDPLPMGLDIFQPQFQEQIAQQQYVNIPAPLPYAAAPDQITYVPDSSQGSYADKVLDDAVNELFLNEAAWDPLPGFSDEDDDSSLQDTQLGIMLEQLLEE